MRKINNLSSSKYIIIFNNNDKKICFEKASECFAFLNNIYKLSLWEIIKFI